MRLTVSTNFADVAKQITAIGRQAEFAAAKALTLTAKDVQSSVAKEMARVFDRPTPWTRNSLRIKYATKANLSAEVAFKDRAATDASRSVLQPHAFGGKRHYKAFEARLLGMGILPSGWNAVPGAAAQLDGFGNMAQGQINQVLNVMTSYAAGGGSKTIDRLAKGNKKKGVYGFEYFVLPPGANPPGKHLPPGIYQRVATGFGTSVKPVLVFVKQANYKARLDFYAIGQRAVDRDLQSNFRQAIEQAIATARED